MNASDIDTRILNEGRMPLVHVTSFVMAAP
jgi:hypothetical protein